MTPKAALALVEEFVTIHCAGEATPDDLQAALLVLDAAVTHTPAPSADYRLKITDDIGNAYYVIRRNGHVFCTNKTMTPLSLSYVAPNAAELSFALQDALHAAEALEKARPLIYGHYSITFG